MKGNAMKRILILISLMLMLGAVLSLSACDSTQPECTHEWTDATCTSPKTCKLCAVTEGEANGHSIILSVTEEQTCEGEGELTAVCSVCGETETERTPAKGHTYTHVITAPDCTEGGYTTHTCHCGHSYTDSETEPLGHSLTAHAAKAESCSEVGHAAYEECSRCDYTTYREIQRSEHSFSTRTSAATCSTPGFVMKVCEECSYTELLSYTSAFNHDLRNYTAKEPTCSEVGWSAYKECSRCDYTTYTEIPKLLHDYTTETVDASCTLNGYTLKVCNDCGHRELTDIVEAVGHDTVAHAAKAPTCSSVGYNAYETCKNCDYTTYAEAPALEHEFTVFTQEVNCIFDGIVMNICDECGYTELVSHTPSVGEHNYTATVTPPTCTKGGYTTYTCEGCNDSYVGAETEAHGHGFGEWYIYEEISASSDGLERRNCMNCNDYETRDIEKLDSGNLGKDSAGNRVDSIIYTIYADGTMKLVGTGATYAGSWNGSQQPYIERRADIKRVIIGEGITQTSGSIFAYFTNLEYVYIPTTLKKLGNNTFMSAFSSKITSFTIPATVEYLGTYLLGKWNGSGDSATFTDITIENPDTIFYNDGEEEQKHIFNGKEVPKTNLTLYSYGDDNNVKKHAELIGAAYVNLNDVHVGTDGDIDYRFSMGTLTLTPNKENATLPSTMSWLEDVERGEVERIVIGEGITAIPENYFKNYTAVTSIELPDGVTSIGGGAFASDASCTVALDLTFPQSVGYIGAAVFAGRSNVTLHGFEDSAIDGFSESGVTLYIKRAFRILLIGNSLSQDAADANKTTTSQLYHALKAMLGESSYVQVGVLCYGARSAGWHATVAEQGRAEYTFYVISDDTDGKWTSMYGKTSVDGLTYADWDVVTIQPYSVEATTGVGSMTADTDGSGTSPKDEKFCALSVSLPYLLDHIDEHAPNADVYYYMTWATTTSTHALNLQADNLSKRIAVAKECMSYTGTNSGKAFSGIINAGTAIQNARQTYLAYLNYKLPDVADSAQLDPVYGIQRDGVHISYYFGRYILALTFAEILIPESKRADGYELPGIPDSCEIGELPPEYAEIAQLAVKEAVKSISAEGNAQYMPVDIQGYKTDPATALANAIATADFKNMSALDAAALLSAIEDKIKLLDGGAKDGIKISVVFVSTPTLSSTLEAFEATVVITYGYTTETVAISGNARLS